MTKEELKKLEQHLKCPSGATGIKLGNNMYKSNSQMILDSFQLLNLKPKQKVLEIGHGNGEHIKKVLKPHPSIEYYGLETSDTMRKEASKHSKGLNTNFSVYNGINIPFNDNYFDRIVSINTIYFWSEPIKLLQEIEQTLKPNGLSVLSFIDKELMKNLSFVGEEFTLYDTESITKLIESTKLKIVEVSSKTENAISKSGEHVERKYTMIQLKKVK